MPNQANLIVAASLEAAGLPEGLQRPSVDVHHYLKDNFGVDEARDLTSRSHREALINKRQTFVIVANGLTIEAQNALLKIFEEPPASAVFYLIVPDASLLLPTLRSRLIVLDAPGLASSQQLAKEFLALSYKDRLSLVADKVKAKDVAWMDGLLAELGSMSRDFDQVAKQSLINSARYLKNRGASRKMLLEELALSL